MEARTIVLIDNDLQFYGEVSQRLTPYGFEIHQGEIQEGSIEMAVSLAAELVIIAVDLPDKYGFALCHKATKRLTCPVVLKTNTIASEDLAKHKELKSRADGYIDHRTQTSDEFLQQVEALVGLNARRLDSNPDLGFDLGEDSANVDDALGELEEIEMEDFEIEDFDEEDVPEDVPEDVSSSAAEFQEEGGTQVGAHSPSQESPQENSIDVETDAAFAAMGFGDEEPATASGFDTSDLPIPEEAASAAQEEPHLAASEEDEEVIEVLHHDPVDEPVPMSREDEALGEAVDASFDSTMGGLEEEELPAEPEPAPEPVAAQPEPEPVPEQPMAAQAEPVPEPEPVPEQPMAAQAEPEVVAAEAPQEAAPAVEPDDLDLGLAAIAQTAAEEQVAASTIAPEELTALRAENDDLKRQLETAQAAAGGASSKEREFLDLRERINKKEKALLDAQDQLTARDRELLDSKDVLLTLNRGKAALDEKILQLEQERLAGKESSDSLRAQLGRAETATQTAASQHAEALTAKDASHATALAAAKAETETAHAARQQEAATLQAELEKSKGEHAAASAQSAQEQAQAVEALRSEHAAALATREGEIEAQKQSEMAGLATQQEQMQTAHAVAIAELQQQAQTALDAQSKEHGEHKAALDQAAAQLEQATAAAESQRVQALQSAAEEREASETQLMAKAAADREALEQEHGEVVAGHERENTELRSALSGGRDRITELEQKMAAIQAASDERLAQLQAKDAVIATNDDSIAALKNEITELEGQNASYQEQVLRAYQKIKTDENTVGRAKKAMAIALTLLDESADLGAEVPTEQDAASSESA